MSFSVSNYPYYRISRRNRLSARSPASIVSRSVFSRFDKAIILSYIIIPHRVLTERRSGAFTDNNAHTPRVSP